MEHHHHVNHMQHQGHAPEIIEKERIMPLAISATVHCLIGCGLGEVGGMVIGQAFGLSMGSTMAVAIALGFVMGILFGIVPLLRRKFTLSLALKTVFVGESLSIIVMEAFELGTQLAIPGVMEAGLTDGIFWMGMAAALVVGFFAALPVNYFMIKRGVRHMH